MFKITINSILNLLDAAKQKGLVKFATNDVIRTDDWSENNYFGDYRYLYYCFNNDEDGDVHLNEQNVDKMYFYGKDYVCGDDNLLVLEAYYKCYIEVFDVEPFNLAQELFDYLEIGGEYGWTGNPFCICTSKKLSKNGTITTKLIHCDNSSLPGFSEEYTKRFKINPKNEDFDKEIMDFCIAFRYPNQTHYPIQDNKLDIIQSAEKAIKNNKHALKILKRIKKTK